MTGDEHSRHEPASLVSILPPGIITRGDRATEGARQAAEMFRSIDRLLHEFSRAHARKAAFCLLQSLPRMLSEEHSSTAVAKDDPFLREFAAAISPAWYEGVFGLLSNPELETLFKRLPDAHESWGTIGGMAKLTATMLRTATNAPFPVTVPDLLPEEREIPEALRSKLGGKDERSFSKIGGSFVLGKHFKCRPQTYRILIGPINAVQHEQFQKAGWATGTAAGEKLRAILDIAEPFYVRAEVVFVPETQGFQLGSSMLGTDRLIGIDSAPEGTRRTQIFTN